MNWKPSKRQAQLKQRLINSSRVYWETSRSLNRMLLKMLHNKNVYTPDDFYNRYIRSHRAGRPERHPRPIRHFPSRDGGYGDPSHIHSNDNADVKRSINHTLGELDQVLHQLKHIVNDDR